VFPTCWRGLALFHYWGHHYEVLEGVRNSIVGERKKRQAVGIRFFPGSCAGWENGRRRNIVTVSVFIERDDR